MSAVASSKKESSFLMRFFRERFHANTEFRIFKNSHLIHPKDTGSALKRKDVEDAATLCTSHYNIWTTTEQRIQKKTKNEMRFFFRWAEKLNFLWLGSTLQWESNTEIVRLSLSLDSWSHFFWREILLYLFLYAFACHCSSWYDAFHSLAPAIVPTSIVRGSDVWRPYVMHGTSLMRWLNHIHKTRRNWDERKKKICKLHPYVLS